MEELGEAAKLFVYLKYIELALGLLLAPFVLYYIIRIFRQVMK